MNENIIKAKALKSAGKRNRINSFQGYFWAGFPHAFEQRV
jgi:hypothetical protein